MHDPAPLVDRLRALATEEQRAALERALVDRTETVILGVRMGSVFALADEHLDLQLNALRSLLHRREHEARVLALSVLGRRAKREAADSAWLREAAALYVAEHDRVVSWDLVDLAAPFVLGRLALADGTSTLDALAGSADPLRQRSALLGALTLVRRGRTTDAVRLALGMLASPAEQLQRTIGALLREVGKADRGLLVSTLEQHGARMTAIALRAATERLEPGERERLRGLRDR
ncbi:DNA alkylation repair protein [Agrococcus sp. 1P02AA]|uniref:DNA alkylation repair protein n=1 Tax=Agrococcus sp. 1P02AA TaxID=3132259 RepID=UPI0039A47F35